MDNNCINKNICIELELNTPHIEIELEMGAKGKDGKDATINGVRTLNVVAGNNISLEQEGSTLTITGTYEYDDTGIKNDINEINEELKNYALKEDVPTKVSQLENDSNYVRNTDYATSTVAGVIKTNAGLDVDENGMVVADTYNYDEYKSKTDNNFISKGTLENVITGNNLETVNNKVTSLGTGSTDIEYPSAKCTYKIKEDLDNLKSDILETGTASDSFINVQDSAWAELQELSVDGVCEQKTTTGKNLLNIPDLTVTSNGVTTVVKNGEITVSGTCTENWFIIASNLNIPLKAGTYTYSRKRTDAFRYNLGITLLSGATKTLYGNVSYNTTITVEEDFILTGISSDANKVGTSFNFSDCIQLEQGSTATDYEPYTGGQPSPSPDYPQEIKTITDSLSVTSCNNNLFDTTKIASGTSQGISYSVDNNGIIILNGITNGNSIEIPLNTNISLNGTYTYIPKVNDKTKINNIALKDASYNNVVLSPIPTISNINGIVIKIVLYVSNGVVFNNDTLSIQILKGTQSTATSFEQHLENQIEANLPEGEFIGKINDTYKDTLKVEYNEDDGQHHLNLYKNIKKVVLDGSENWIKSGNSSDNFFCGALAGQDIPFQAKMDTNNYTKTNYFIKGDKSSNSEVFDMYNGTKYYTVFALFLSTSKVSDIASFKTWLSTHNTEVYYILAEPYEIDLGVVDMPLSYNEVTNIFTDSDLLPQINAKYYRNFITTIRNLQVNNDTLKNELVSIENRLAKLEKAKENVTNNEEVSI